MAEKELAAKLTGLIEKLHAGADEVLAEAEGDAELFEFVLKILARSIKVLEDGANSLKETINTEAIVTAKVKTAGFISGPTSKSLLIDIYNQLEETVDASLIARITINLKKYLETNPKSENAALFIDFIENSNALYNVADEILGPIKNAIVNEIKKLEQTEKQAAFALDKLIHVATAFDESGDEELQKAASVLDELLLTIAAPKGAFAQERAKSEAEVNRLREKYRDEANKKLYSDTKEVHDEGAKAAAVEKALAGKKVYKPMEAPLSTRYCPDHPGVGVIRIADRVYQCALDHKIYNYETGFTTMKGNQVPGGSVDQQTDLDGHGYGPLLFESRQNGN